MQGSKIIPEKQEIFLEMQESKEIIPENQEIIPENLKNLETLTDIFCDH